jgi:predicted alpha/beta superfamily hydrolase
MAHSAIALLLLGFGIGTGTEDPIVIGETRRIHSAVLNEDRVYRVSLPESYGWAKDRRYPVLFLLDGQTHFVHVAGSVAYLAQQGDIPEMIVIGIDSTVRVRDFTQSDWPSHWIGGGGASHFKRFLSTELIPDVDKHYRADKFRVLSGHSAGGQFALYCLTTDPSLFQAYFAISSSLDWDDNLPQRSLEQSLKATQELKAFLYVARCDDSGRPLADYEKLVETLKTNSPQGFRWFERPYPDETHGSVALLAHIDALRQLYSGYRFHPDMAAKGLAFAEQHFRDVSKKVGWPLAVPESVMNELGYAALSQNKTEDAISLFKRNVEANPNSANAYDSLADGYAKAAMWEEAVSASERAAALAVEFDLPNRAEFIARAKRMHERLKQSSENAN